MTDAERHPTLSDAAAELRDAFTLINETILPVSQAETILKARNKIALVNNFLLDLERAQSSSNGNNSSGTES